MEIPPGPGATHRKRPAGRCSVAVFAYNEAAVIEACLDSIETDCRAEATTIYVLMNGCTDGTDTVVRSYAVKHPNVTPVAVRLGDKANAWNHYVHDVAPDADFHCFVDGDVTITAGSLAGMANCFADHPEADAAAALPAGGRSRDVFRDKLVRKRELAGNFYGLRGTVIDRFRNRGVRLPTGLFGEDGLVTTLVKWDLDPLGACREERVIACVEAGFGFESLSPFVISHWRIYRNRKMRYAVRRQQAGMLYPLLFQRGIAAMPNHVVDLYRAGKSELRLEWNGWNTVFDYLAIRRIRKKLDSDNDSAMADEARFYS